MWCIINFICFGLYMCKMVDKGCIEGLFFNCKYFFVDKVSNWLRISL